MSPAQVIRDWPLYSPIKRLTLIATLISAVTAAIIAVMNLTSTLEPKWIATRGFVREQIQTAEQNTGTRLLSLEIAQKESARDAAQAKLDGLEFELRKNPDAPESLKQILNDQIRRYSEQVRVLNLELDDLRRLRAGRRP